MQLPPLFTEYTRALLGEEEYNRLAAALVEAGPAGQHPAECPEMY